MDTCALGHLGAGHDLGWGWEMPCVLSVAAVGR